MSLFKKRLNIALYLFAVLLMFVQSCGEDNIQNPGQHFTATGLFIQAEGSSDTLVYYHNGTFVPGKDSLSVNETDTSSHLKINFLDANRNVISPPQSSEYSLGLDVANQNIVRAFVHNRWGFRLVGIAAGETNLKIKVMHTGHADFTSMPIRIRVIP